MRLGGDPSRNSCRSRRCFRAPDGAQSRRVRHVRTAARPACRGVAARRNRSIRRAATRARRLRRARRCARRADRGARPNRERRPARVGRKTRRHARLHHALGGRRPRGCAVSRARLSRGLHASRRRAAHVAHAPCDVEGTSPAAGCHRPHLRGDRRRTRARIARRGLRSVGRRPTHLARTTTGSPG